MTPRLQQGWCPTCHEWTVIDVGQPCAWCDTTIVTRRGGWKRPDLAARSNINPAQARAIHAKHQQGTSLREISRHTWQTLGYKTPESCLLGIAAALRREGLHYLDQAQATAKANRDRTLRQPGETIQAFKRRRRREHGYRCHRTGEWRIAKPQPPSTSPST